MTSLVLVTLRNSIQYFILSSMCNNWRDILRYTWIGVCICVSPLSSLERTQPRWRLERVCKCDLLCLWFYTFWLHNLVLLCTIPLNQICTAALGSVQRSTIKFLYTGEMMQIRISDKNMVPLSDATFGQALAQSNYNDAQGLLCSVLY